MTPEEKLELIKRNTLEVVQEDELLQLIKEKEHPVAYIGYAPTGQLHIGHFFPLMKVKDFIEAGFKFTFLIADLHAFLDDMKCPWNLLQHRTEYYKKATMAMLKAVGVDTTNITFVQGSTFQLKKEYQLDTLHLCGEVTVNRSKRAASEVVRFKEDPKLGGFVYPLMQILDPIYLNADVSYGGVDQRGIYMLGRELLPKLKGRTLLSVFTPLLPGLSGGKMSASDASSKIGILESEEEVLKKAKKAFCEEGVVEENGVLVFFKHVLFPLKKETITIERPEKFGGNLTYDSYEALEKDFAEKKLHPMDLKACLAKEVNILLQPVRKAFEGSDVVKKAYPE
ncbi:tyrosine--tRNA ligase [Candidatus Woesearchaeota archaeon]|nr:tyrosine--tRNA ligase [Candidatus Woesearchaeota archaeon]